MILLIAGWALLLLPLSLANYASAGWGSASIISMLVIGFVCLVGISTSNRSYKSFTTSASRMLDTSTASTALDLASGELW
jgi:hypothetical protein